MSEKNDDLHGNAPDKSEVALLLIDVINDLEFEGGDELLTFVLPMAERLADLKRRARQANVPIIYVNDNFGKWQSDFRKLLAHCLEDGVRGEPIVKLLQPQTDDYFVLKPKHSGFFSTTLDVLLQYLQVKRLLLTGISGDVCVLFTANDAYMRDYQLLIPADCVASIDPQANQQMLRHMERILKADTRPSSEIQFHTGDRC